MSDSPHIAYINIEADALLRTCFAQLGKQNSYEECLELMLRGTLPRKILEDIEANSTIVDPKSLSDRFSAKKRIYIDSWAELLNLGSITYFHNAIQTLNTHFVSSIGIETAYRESSLREKFLGDGAIASRALGRRQIVQSCLAQNIRGNSAGGSLQEEVIARLQAKLSTSPAEPERVLAVMIMSETEDIDKLNFWQIAKETVEKYKNKTTYSQIFCIMPSVGFPERKPQVVVAPLITFSPGGPGTIAIIKSEFFMESP